MAKIDLPKRSGKRSKVKEKSVKSQGILKTILSGNPVNIKVPQIIYKKQTKKQQHKITADNLFKFRSALKKPNKV